MEQQPRPQWTHANGDAGRQFAQLTHVRSLVEQMAGRPPRPQEVELDRSARISAAYDSALPINQKRFEVLAAETAAWAATAAQALLNDGRQPPAAAACLADELTQAQRQMERILGL